MKLKNLIRILIGSVVVVLGLIFVGTKRIMPFIEWLARAAKKVSKFSIRRWRYKMRLKHRARKIIKRVKRKLRESV